MNINELKLRLRGLGIPQWRLAQELNISEATLQRRFHTQKESDIKEMLSAMEAIVASDSRN